MIHKLNLIKILNFCSLKDTIKKMKRQAIDGRGDLEYNIFDKKT